MLTQLKFENKKIKKLKIQIKNCTDIQVKNRGRLVEAVEGRNMVVKGSSKRSLPKES